MLFGQFQQGSDIAVASGEVELPLSYLMEVPDYVGTESIETHGLHHQYPMFP